MELKDPIHAPSSTHNDEDALSMSTSLPSHTNSNNYDDVFQFAKKLKFGELHFKIDNKTGLFAIIAIHNTKLGPAIGGCRCLTYPSTQAAINDAVRLAHMMSYKAAICALPHGGAKAVLMKPSEIADRQAYFQSFAEFVNELNGRYITAVDSGTGVEEMNIISTRTPFVTCTSQGGGGDPSPLTALGVKRGIEAAVKFKLGKENLVGIHVAIQGAGHVGYNLARYLHQSGARITMTDTDANSLQRCIREFDVGSVMPEDIYQVECDVFAPCALGSSLNATTIPQLKTQIIAGAANNQLRDLIVDDQRLFEKGILYAPDFLINSGGLIYAAAAYDHGSLQQAEDQIFHIYEALMNIFERAKAEKKPTNQVAQQIAEERLN